MGAEALRFPASRRGSVTLHPCGAPAPGHAAWLTGALGFTIPPAWLCHAVPPLHMGGFSLPCGIQRTWGNHSAWPVVFTQAKTAPLCKGSCRRTPTEGLPACLADDAHARRLVSSICLCAINPPGGAAWGPSGQNEVRSSRPVIKRSNRPMSPHLAVTSVTNYGIILLSSALCQ